MRQTRGEKIDSQLFDDLLETMQLGSLCALGGGLPLPVKNALQYFSDELKELLHSKGGIVMEKTAYIDNKPYAIEAGETILEFVRRNIGP